MIPTIGLMIGAYIITRMVSFISRSGERKEPSIVIVCAIITIIVVLISLVALFASSVSTISSQ